MKVQYLFALMIVAVCIVPVSAIIKPCTSGNCMNQTINLTANMTAGPQGIQGVNGTPGLPGSSATVGVNATFTGLPGTMASVVNIGTDVAAAFNFVIPTGAAGLNNMTMNMTANMTAGPPGGTGGQVLFFNNTAVGVAVGYEGLFPVPSGATEVDESDTVNSGTGQVLIDPYSTTAGYPCVTTIPAGLWRFRTFHYVSSASGTTTVVFKVYNRTAGGAETLQFSATSGDINALVATEYLTSYVQTSNINMPSTDTIVIKVYGQSTHPSDIDLHFVYQGSEHTSHVQTPLEAISTNYRTIAQDDLQDAEVATSTLGSADTHIQLNVSTINQWISLNKTQILTATVTNTTAAQAAALRAADDHISTNSSSGISYATLLEADNHIASNKSAILTATQTNVSNAQAAAVLNAGNLIAINRTLILSGEVINNTAAQYAALRAADDHISTNSSAGELSAVTLLEADSHIASNKTAILSATLINVTSAQAAALRAADDHIATNASSGGVSAPAALQAADAHILTNMTLGAGANWTTQIETDFFDPSTQAIPGFLGAAILTGTVGAVASDANHPGVIYMRDSTTAAGGYRYGCQGTQVLNGGEFFEVVFQPVGVRGTQASKFGWADTAAAATLPVDGVWFNVSGTGAAQTFVGASSKASSRSYTPTYTTTTATWYRGTISLNPTASVITYALYSPSGVSLWQNSISSNIPNATGQDTSPCIIVSETSTDAAADILRLDYVRWGTTKVVSR